MKTLLKSLELTIIATLFLGTIPAHASGGRDGGGGDATESHVYDIRQDILDWINRGDARALKFSQPQEMNYTLYVTRMLSVLAAPPSPNAVIVAFTTTEQEQRAVDPELKVYVNGQPKSCRGFISVKDRMPHILCNTDRFPKIPGEEYRIIHHEFAGLAGVERNSGAASDYEFSNQLGEFGQYEKIYRLGIRKGNITATSKIEIPDCRGEIKYPLNTGVAVFLHFSVNSQALKSVGEAALITREILNLSKTNRPEWGPLITSNGQILEINVAREYSNFFMEYDHKSLLFGDSVRHSLYDFLTTMQNQYPNAVTMRCADVSRGPWYSK